MPKTVLITGANGNLGTAVVRKFMAAGFHVIAVDASQKNLEFAKETGNFEFHSVDLTDEPATTSFIKGVQSRHNSISAALLLVGGFAMGGFEATDGNVLRKMFSLNFETAYYTARPLFLDMLKSGYGRLVFVGARPAIKPDQGKNMIAYALSKSLIFRLAELLNAEAKNKNVVASVIVPSTIDTPSNRESMPDADPSKWVKPEEIADLLEMICSEKGNVLRETVLKLYKEA